MHRIEKNRVRPLGTTEHVATVKQPMQRHNIIHPKNKKRTSLRQHSVCINNVAAETDKQPQMLKKETEYPEGLGFFSEQLSLKSIS